MGHGGVQPREKWEFRWSFSRIVFTQWPFGLTVLFCCFSLPFSHTGCFSEGKCLLPPHSLSSCISHYQNKKSPHTSLGHCSRVHRSKLRSVFQLAIIICIHETNFPLVSHSLVVSQALTLSGCPAVIQSIAEPGGPPRGNLVHAPNSTQEKCLTSCEFYSSLHCQKPLMAKQVSQFVQRPKVFLLSSLETKSNWSVSFFLSDTSNDGY